MLVEKLADKVKTEGVGLGVLPSESLVAKSLVNEALAVDGLLYTESVGDLTESDVPVESLLVKVILLVRSQNHDANRVDNPVELLHHNVAKEGRTGTGLCLNFLIVREIQSNQLYSVTGAVDGVVGVDVGLVARNKSLVLLLARDLLLELRKHRLELIENLGTLEILEEHISLVGCLETIELVIIDLVRADDEVHLAVRHLQPGKVAVIIIVSPQRVDLLEKIVAHARLDGDVSGGLEVVADLVDVILERVVVPNGSELAVGAATDE